MCHKRGADLVKRGWPCACGGGLGAGSSALTPHSISLFPSVAADCLCFVFQVLFTLKQGPDLWNWWAVKAPSEASENCRCPNATETIRP